jgi:adenylosuccinate synthase
MLEKARKCPDGFWPLAKKRTLDALEKGAVVNDPGMTAKKIAKERKRVGDLLDKARSLSDVEFEMEKENLAAQIKTSAQETPEHLRDFNSAFFLLMPGTVRVYDKLIEHLDEQKPLAEGEKEE